MRLCLFEDRGALDLEPLTLTRPAFDLLCGQTSLAAKQCRAFGPGPAGVLVRPHLAELYRFEHPDVPVNDLTWLRSAPTVLVNGRWLPPPAPPAAADGPCIALAGEEVAWAAVGPEQLTYCSGNTLDDCLETWKLTLPTRPAGGRLVRHLWDLVEHNAEQIVLEHEREAGFVARWSRPGDEGPLPALVGPAERLYIDPTAQLDPMVVADTTRGPVVVAAQAVVAAFTRLEGPCYVGPHTHVLGAKVRAGTTLGPHCRVGGEVEASIVQGHSNKYHDGFLGHAYVGEWVNLGAGTSNSDLRNDYGEVRVTVAGRLVDTGMKKVGCFLGDHTKTGLGALLNTGTSAGVFCDLLPGGLLPRHVPSFCRCRDGTVSEQPHLGRLLQTAAEVMRRRGRTFTDAHAGLYRALYEQTAPGRRQPAHEGSQRLRLSA
jgi:UDP-N-acetylglucosamine diphosphorylase/glucosamine-1-phosphate N-acetyltransferase